MKKLLANKLGMSLIEITLAVAITGALSLYVSKIVLNLQKAQKNNEVEASIMFHAQAAQSALFRDVLCNQAVGGLTLNTVTGESSATYEADILNPSSTGSGFEDLNNYARFIAGTVMDNGDARFIKARVVNYSQLNQDGADGVQDQDTAIIEVQHIYEKFPNVGGSSDRRQFKSGQNQRYLYFYTWLKVGENASGTVSECRGVNKKIIDQSARTISDSFITLDGHNTIEAGNPLSPTPPAHISVGGDNDIHLANADIPGASHLNYIGHQVQQTICEELGGSWDGTRCGRVHSGAAPDNERCQTNTDHHNHFFARGFNLDGNIVAGDAETCMNAFTATTCKGSNASPGSCSLSPIGEVASCNGLALDGGTCELRKLSCPAGSTKKSHTLTIKFNNRDADGDGSKDLSIKWQGAYSSSSGTVSGISWSKSSVSNTNDTITWSIGKGEVLNTTITYLINDVNDATNFSSASITVKADCIATGVPNQSCPASHPAVAGLVVSNGSLICSKEDGSDPKVCGSSGFNCNP